jgi:ankyrin repeat protein
MLRHFINIGCALAAVVLLPGQAGAQPRVDPAAFGARVELGDVMQVRSWLSSGLPPDFVADRIGTGLMIAAWRGDLPMMQVFVEHGADVNRANALGERALMHAAWRGHTEAVKWLLSKGARAAGDPGRWGPLHYAAFAGHGEIAALLLENGADVNARTPNGSTALMMAVYEGKEDVVKQLLARGADPVLKNDRGEGALDWAFKHERLAIARIVASPSQFAAAANLPRSHWPQAVRSQAPEPAQAAAAPPRAPDPLEREINDLVNRRNLLASRGITKLDALDRRIARLRVQRLRADIDAPGTLLLEISARRASPRRSRRSRRPSRGR